jgi:predicted DNA-binding protein
MPKKVGRRVMTSAYLDPEVYEALGSLSERLGIPAAELVRQAISDLLLRYRVRIATRRGKLP